MAKSLRQILEQRITDFYITANSLGSGSTSKSSYENKAELLQSVLDEFDGKE